MVLDRKAWFGRLDVGGGGGCLKRRTEKSLEVYCSSESVGRGA